MTDAIREIERELYEKTQRLHELRAQAPPEPVDDHEFRGPHGPVRLHELFDGQGDLVVLHSMGKSCDYCTLWADTLVSTHPKVLERAAFVLVSPDGPAEQAALAKERGWPYRMVQDESREFTTKMGYYSEKDGWWPAMSGLRRHSDGRIVRTNTTILGPGDAFCPVWHVFSLLADGARGWQPN